MSRPPGSVVHLCPPDGEQLTPCCGETPFNLPRSDRMTSDPSAVTCAGCLACSDLGYGDCDCRDDCGHPNCTRRQAPG